MSNGFLLLLDMRYGSYLETFRSYHGSAMNRYTMIIISNQLQVLKDNIFIKQL